MANGEELFVQIKKLANDREDICLAAENNLFEIRERLDTLRNNVLIKKHTDEVK